jgi:hypothetical protein
VFIQPDDINGNPVRFNGHPEYVIFNLAGKWCLTEAAALPGSPVVLGACSGNINMWFEVRSAGNPAGPDFQLVALFGDPDDMCVSAGNSSDSNGTPLVMEPCDSTDARQLFNLG